MLLFILYNVNNSHVCSLPGVDLLTIHWLARGAKASTNVIKTIEITTGLHVLGRIEANCRRLPPVGIFRVY